MYDTGGQRVRKVSTYTTGQKKKERIYVDGFEIYREFDGGGTVTLQRETLHIMDDQRRIAIVDRQTIGTVESLVRYQLGNHLGSSAIELDEAANVISYEEYFAFGATSYRATRGRLSSSSKRYRYTGKEKDEENGLYYHGARYYASWLGRWTSVEPLIWSDNSQVVRADRPYVYVENQPLSFVDPDGTIVESGWDLFSLGIGLTSLTYNAVQGNWKDAALDLVGVVADAGALVVPGVPGGAGYAIKATRTSEKVVRNLQRADTAVNVYQGVESAKNAVDSYKEGDTTGVVTNTLGAGLSVLHVGSRAKSSKNKKKLGEKIHGQSQKTGIAPRSLAREEDNDVT